jgi:sialidase-1
MNNCPKIIQFVLIVVLLVASLNITYAEKTAYELRKDNDDTSAYKIISKGGEAGDYQAFPDAIRLKNGEILVAFYSGDEHVTKSSTKYPNAGRICFVRSKNEGKTWSEPKLLYDDIHDNRDAHLTQLKDGTIICTFFNLRIDSAKHGEVRMVTSKDNGRTWDKTSLLIAKDWFTSASVKQLSNGSLMQPVYTIVDKKNSTRIGFVYSNDMGATWSTVNKVGWENNFTVNETDVVVLKDGTLYAALRGAFKEQVPMQCTTSDNLGQSWKPLKSIGFYGDAPSFTRLRSGEILLSTRGYPNNEKTGSAYTSLNISSDEAKSWQGPYLVDKSPGAYPSTIELKDNTILVIFYQEGAGSGIGAIRFKKPLGITGVRFKQPKPLEKLPL